MATLSSIKQGIQSIINEIDSIAERVNNDSTISSFFMKRLKKLLLLSIILILMIGVSGCMSTETKLIEPERMKNLALEYLNENYDDTFTARSYSGKSWAYSYRTVNFYSEKYPDSAITVEIHENDDGSYYFIDNYYQCYMYDDAVAYFESIVEGIEPLSVKVYFQAYVYSDRLNGATSFAEWVANGSCHLNVSFITQETLSDEEMYSIVQTIADNKIRGTIRFIASSYLLDVSLDDILNNQSTYVESKSSFFIGSGFEISKDY